MSLAASLAPDTLSDAEVLWAYHDLHHTVRPTDVAIGLGSHDLSVATCAAELYHRGLFPLIVFSGANAPTTVDLFPRGEAVHYAEEANSLGVPTEAILVEPDATNTAENIENSRAILHGRGIEPSAVTLITRPYQQRRAYATFRKLWPQPEVNCQSLQITLPAYIDRTGEPDRVLNMLVGDTQRITEYAQRGFAIEQPMPDHVRAAYQRLVAAGYTARLIRPQ